MMFLYDRQDSSFRFYVEHLHACWLEYEQRDGRKNPNKLVESVMFEIDEAGPVDIEPAFLFDLRTYDIRSDYGWSECWIYYYNYCSGQALPREKLMNGLEPHC